MTKVTTVVFDVGKVLFEWDLRHLFAKLIADKAELEYFVTHVVTTGMAFSA
jgi:2-haloacid dehalogenase